MRYFAGEPIVLYVLVSFICSTLFQLQSLSLDIRSALMLHFKEKKSIIKIRGDESCCN